jgi:hypothetical protein
LCSGAVGDSTYLLGLLCELTELLGVSPK